jgi:hypothetical protein
MNLEQASLLGLIGSGLSIAAFCSLTVVGILFVRLLDFFEGYCTNLAARWRQARAILSSDHSAGEDLGASRTARPAPPANKVVSEVSPVVGLTMERTAALP